MIEMTIGKPGGGKGLFAMDCIIDELVKRKRPVITNMAIKMDPWVRGGKAQIGLEGYLLSKYGDTFNVRKRVLILEDAEMARFYAHRLDADGKHIVCPDRADHTGQMNEFDTAMAIAAGGAFYVPDEAWKFWHARGWKDTGQVTLFYAAQHRKFGDDVMICTQHPKQLDTAIRQVVQNYHAVRNHGLERFGLFKQPDMFSVSTFGDVPGPASVVQCRKVFRLDVLGIGGCYDTSAGVGVVGGITADSGKKRKGLSMKWLIPATAAAAIGLLVVPHFAAKGYFSTLKPNVPKVTVAPVPTNAVPAPHSVPREHAVPQAVPVAPVFAPLQERRSVASANTVEFERPIKALEQDTNVYLTGVGQDQKGKIWIMLSNGEKYTAGDPEVRLVTDKYVVIENKVYKWPRREQIEPAKAASLPGVRPPTTGGQGPSVLGQVSPKPLTITKSF